VTPIEGPIEGLNGKSDETVEAGAPASEREPVNFNDLEIYEEY
jgi:hypothetical protein